MLNNSYSTPATDVPAPNVRKLKITFLLPLANMSGGIRVISIYAMHLQKMGHHVVLVSVPPRRPTVRERLRSLKKLSWNTHSGPTSSHLDGHGLNHYVIDSYRPIQDSDVPDADAVIATWWETAEWVHQLSPNKGAKFYFVQGHEVFSNLPVARCQATYRLPLKKITIAKWLVEVMRTEYGDTEVALVPNAVDHTQFFASKRDKQVQPTLGFMLHDSHFKGVDIALKVIEIVKNNIPNLRVLSFGSHAPGRHLELPSYVEFHLRPAQDSIRDIYAQCDVWLTCSRSEGFNLPAMEAMACRTPVVSTRTGWPYEAIQDGGNGYLSDIDDTLGLAHNVTRILTTSGEKWKIMSENAHDTVKNSSWRQSSNLFFHAIDKSA